MTITKQEFDFIRGWAKDRAAIALDEDKTYLVESRLEPVAKRHGLTDLSELVRKIHQRESSDSIEDETIDALTTNETLFFRDSNPFELMRTKLFPELIEARKSERSLTIWSAAASTGQEIYSIAMLVHEYFPELLDWDLKLIATDLSPTVLAKAKEGIYSGIEANRGLRSDLKGKYFEEVTSSRWQVKSKLRSMVSFSRLNLIEAWPDFGSLDVIFLRNVLIYFDVETKRQILQRARTRLKKDGLLFLGTAETTINIDQQWSIENEAGATYYRPIL